MAKATRSPVLGYNHNVRYHGRIYHVQTEDSGPGHTRVFTHLFFEGTIIASKRYDYADDFNDEAVKGVMQAQHKGILKELKQGLFDPKIVAFFATRGQDGFLDAAGPTGADVGDQTLETPGPPTWGSTDVHPVTGGAAPVAPPPAPPVVPVAQGTILVPALDLDALPPIEPDEPPLPPVIVDAPGTHQGVGVYSMRGRVAERPFETPPEGVQPRPTPPPAGRAPVVVIRPPVRRPLPRPPSASPPPGGVVVQRTVVVGVGGNGPGGQRPRRPRPAVPYVVKEGSHPIVQNPRAAQVAPPIPGSTPQPPATISDKSLDEVILAYLSQDNEPKR